jgi:hypothetical protein
MLPDNLTAAKEAARAKLASSEDGSLPRGYREEIWATFVPLKCEDQTVIESPACLRKTHLALLAAIRVLPIWDSVFRRQRIPHIF